jgi:hypothetical protein
MTLIGTRLEVRIPGAENGFLRSLQQEGRSQARNVTKEPPAEGFRTPLRQLDLLPNEQSSLTTLLASIAHNQLTLNRQLAALDAWMNDNRLSNRTGRSDAIQ